MDAAMKCCSADDSSSGRSGSMSAAIGGGSRRLSCSTLAGCASIRKSNASWPSRDASRLRSTARKRGAVGERFIGLAHDRHVEKRVEWLSVLAMRGSDESPLLHVAQMIVAHVLVALEQLPLRRCWPTRGRSRAFTIIQSCCSPAISEAPKRCLGFSSAAIDALGPSRPHAYLTQEFVSFTAILGAFRRATSDRCWRSRQPPSAWPAPSSNSGHI